MMTFNPQDYSPVYNPWFSIEISYEGRGRAEFLHPTGWVEGTTSVQVDMAGQLNIEMIIDSHGFQDPTKATGNSFHDIAYLLTGTTMSIGSKPDNECTKLVIETEVGWFSVIEFENISYSWLFGERISFDAVLAQFEASNNNVPEYWVMPLTNFISGIFRHRKDYQIFYHPLRLFMPPKLSDNLSKEERLQAFLKPRSRDISIFKFEEECGFIERIVNYEEIKRRLENYEAKTLITAVIVGPIESNGINYEAVKEWIPLDFVILLSLATGTLVGTPWIELRDSQARLVKRFHIAVRQAPYHKGSGAFRDIGAGMIGYFLSKAPRHLTPSLRVAICQTVKGSKTGMESEDNFSFLARALDALRESPDADKPIIGQMQSDDLLKQVKAILVNAQQEVLKLAKTAKQDGKLTEAWILEDIVSQQIQNIKNTSRKIGFDELIDSLLHKLGLHDADVVKQFYIQHPRQDGLRTFSKVVAKYRAVVIHKNYFTFSDGTHDLEDVIRVQCHLHDLLFRILLKMLKYQGKYETPIRSDILDVDWVQPDTDPAELGYS